MKRQQLLTSAPRAESACSVLTISPAGSRSVQYSGSTDLQSTFWNFDWHRLIADATQRLLDSSPAWPRIADFLKQRFGCASLAEVATWADEIRDGDAGQYWHEPETRRFLGMFRKTATWHYVDLPAGVTGYDETTYPRFTRRPNLVWACALSLRALSGASRLVSPANGFRLLVHLLPDLHQPLHVACAYIGRRHGLAHFVFNPWQAARLSSDGGGSLLVLPNGLDLHTFWDRALGHGLVSVSPGPNELTAFVAEMAAAHSAAPTGSLFNLPAEWSRDSVLAAREAYRNLHVVGLRPGRPTRYRIDWIGDDEAGYILRNQPVLIRQLAFAAQRLAFCLATVFDPSRPVTATE